MTDFMRRLSNVDMSEYYTLPDKDCTDERADLGIKLKNTLSGEDLKLFEAYINASEKCAEEDRCFFFSKGVTMAVQLIIGALSDN